MTYQILASHLDQALANLSDLPKVKPIYDLDPHHGEGFAIWFESQEPADLVRFFLDLQRIDEQGAEQLHEAMYVDRPSYRGEWHVFSCVSLVGHSAYETTDE